MNEPIQPTEVLPPIVVPHRPGLKTTEFWASAAIIILSALVLLGVVDPIQAGEANQDIGIVIDGLVKIASGIIGAATAFGYTGKRTELKASQLLSSET